jgi:pyruvate, water dikinase
MTATRTLRELRRSDEDSFGAKSASLGELIGADVPVPPGFALSAESYLAAVEGVDLGGTAAECAHAVRSTAVPAPLRAEIAGRYEELADETGDPQPPVAVRSSAIGEDSEEATFAGQQETFLWVRGVDGICEAVRNCWASLYSPEAVSYRAEMAAEHAAPAMGVTVQLMVDAAVSGVMFTCNPVSGDRSMVAINASWGLGLAVVGGEVTPDDYLVSKVTGEVVKRTISDKAVEYVPAATGTQRVDVPGDRRTEPSLDDARLATLVAVGKRVEKHFGAPQDIEWAFDPTGDLFVLQSRPVTGLAKPEPTPAPTSAMSMIFNKFGAGG